MPEYKGHLLIKSVPLDVRRAFSAGAVRQGLQQAAFLSWLMRQYAATIIKPPEVSQ